MADSGAVRQRRYRSTNAAYRARERTRVRLWHRTPAGQLAGVRFARKRLQAEITRKEDQLRELVAQLGLQHEVSPA